MGENRSKSKIKTTKVQKSISSLKNEVPKELSYKGCLKYYSEELDNLLIQKITLYNIKNLGQLYYVLKIACNPTE